MTKKLIALFLVLTALCAAVLPASALGGGAFLLIVDDISRCAGQSEIPIGILTAFIGAPFFLYLITKEGRKK